MDAIVAVGNGESPCVHVHVNDRRGRPWEEAQDVLTLLTSPDQTHWVALALEAPASSTMDLTRSECCSMAEPYSFSMQAQRKSSAALEVIDELWKHYCK